MNITRNTDFRTRLLCTTAAVALAVALAGAPAPAFANFNAGVKAFEKGDFRKAYEEWLPLARQGDPAAQRNIGQLYRQGRGVPQSDEVAANWYRLVAQHGHAAAQANLGVMYLQGQGVAKDPAEAARWFDKAAEQGHAIAQYNLALMYEQGLGVEKSANRAMGWYQRAADGGHDRAAQRVAQFLHDKVAPAAGAPAAVAAAPAPATPAPKQVVEAAPSPPLITAARGVETSRSHLYMPREFLACAPEQATAVARAAPQAVAPAVPMPPVDVARLGTEQPALTGDIRPRPRPAEELATPPAAVPGSPAARGAAALPVTPAKPQPPAQPAPAQMAALRPATPEPVAPRLPRPAAVAVPDTSRAPVTPRTEPAPVGIAAIVVPVAPFLIEEARRERAGIAPALIVVPPSPILIAEAEADRLRLAAVTAPAPLRTASPSDVPAFLKREAAADARPTNNAPAPQPAPGRGTAAPVPPLLAREAARDATRLTAPATTPVPVTTNAFPALPPRQAVPPEVVAAVVEPAPAVAPPVVAPAPANDSTPPVVVTTPAADTTAALRREADARREEEITASLNRLEAQPDPAPPPGFLRRDADTDTTPAGTMSAAVPAAKDSVAAGTIPTFLRPEVAPVAAGAPRDRIPVSDVLKQEAAHEMASAPVTEPPDFLVKEADSGNRAVPRGPRLTDTLVREAQAEHDRQIKEARMASLNDEKAPPTFLMNRAGTPDMPGFNPDAARRAVDVGVVAYLARNYEKAYEFWMPVARTGQPDAQFFVGGLYLDGNGVKRDLIEAHTWFARAAVQGHLRAEDSLGTLRKIMTDSQLKEARGRLSRG